MPRHTLPKAEREIAIRLQDRLNWEPGEPHKQDVLFEEAAAAREEIAPVLQAFQATLKQLETVLTTITGRETLDDPDPLAIAETPVQQAIEQRFASRRHYAHLSALFAILRRRNLLGRLQVAQAALELAQALLEDQEAIWQDFLQATEGTEAQVPQPLGLEEQNAFPRVAPASQEEHENIRGAHGPLTPLVGSVAQARHHLRVFEQRLPALRAHLVQRTGRIEIFFVQKKTSFLPDVLALRKAIRRAQRAGKPLDQIDPKLLAAVHPQVAEHLCTWGIGVPLPKALERDAYQFETFGPYGKLRIKGITATQGTRNGPNYAISFGPRNRAPASVFARYFS